MKITKPLQLQAYESIKNKILSGELEHGEIYSETKMAKELSISRTPVRDAMQHLSQEKYIDIIPNKGFTLHKMDLKDFNETVQIRCAIEGYCVQQMARDMKEKGDSKIETAVAEIKELLAKQEQVLKSQKNLSEFAEYDHAFHEKIISYAGNDQLIQLYNTFLYRIKSFTYTSLKHLGRMEATLKEHTDIAINIEKGDILNAYNATIIHLESPKDISLL